MLLITDGWMKRMINLTNQTYQNSTELNFLFVFTFSFQKQIKNLAVLNYLIKIPNNREHHIFLAYWAPFFIHKIVPMDTYLGSNKQSLYFFQSLNNTFYQALISQYQYFHFSSFCSSI